MSQNSPQSPGPLSAASISPEQAAKIFSAVFGQTVTAEEILQIAEEGDLLRADETFNLIHFCAYLVRELSNG